ncbi:PAS domain-containing sensor histidine kinase [Oceanicola sp. 502str15]|uniref:hybrid sensor histidine kinase/response regulator n=1 Tax=Oceanicola sp. 502str15 TaxID=2696061 RepID=UPI002095F3AE|nr:PAS domain-containing protein [Oceanicola sp. 502str15]MCO6382402.1 PAS domain-containing protein [Oceanicola sp. 502str15]
MLIALFQSLSGLLLAGAFLYAIFASESLRARKPLQQALIGLVFGFLVISLSQNSYPVPPRGVPVDANAGPLIFAGYLGGPLGAGIAALFSLLAALTNEGAIPWLGVFVNLAIPLVGLVVGQLHPPRQWPEVQPRTILCLLAGFLPIFLVTTLVAGTSISGLNGYLIAGEIALIVAAVGTVSILLTWQIIAFACRFAMAATHAKRLARKLNLALRHSGIGVFERPVPGSHVVVDAGLLEIYGLKREPGPLAVATWLETIHPEDLPALKAEMQHASRGEKKQDWLDFRAIRPDGAVRHIRGHWFTEHEPGGRVNRVVGLHADITEIREAERRHLDTLSRLALVAENLPGVVLQVDVTDWSDARITYVSDKCTNFWGYTPEEIYADNSLFTSAIDPDDRAASRAHLMSQVALRLPISMRYRVTARDGQLRWMDFHGNSSIQDGRTLLEGIVLDVTQEAEARQQVEAEREIAHQAQKSESIGHLTGGVAHDFNNLLAVILGNLELLRDHPDAAERDALIEAAITASLRGADLTRNMLAFARRARLTPEVLDLNTVVREAKNWMGRTLPESVEVESSLLAGLWPVQADPASLESALLNLILNARDAMGGHGKLTIETSNVRIDEAYLDTRHESLAPGRYVLLAVSDTGEGIGEADINRIFEPFFTTKPAGTGSGLGLSMTLGFMRQSGGTVQVYSEPGCGTTFKLYFPASDKAVAPPRRRPEAAGSDPGKKRLLLVEDEAAVRNTLLAILQRGGYEVTAATSGDEAWEIFRNDRSFDLMLTDIVMPGTLQGTHLAREVRKLRTDLPIVFMSGYANEATVHGNGLRSHDIRLMKPVQRADLLAALNRALTTPTPD